MRKLALIALVALLALSGSALAADPVPVSEDRAATCRTDSAGYCTVTHELGAVPEHIQVTPRIGEGFHAYILTVVKDSETVESFRVRAVFHTGKPKASNNLWFYVELDGTKVQPDPDPEPEPDPDPPPPPPPPDPDPSPTAGAVCGTSALDGPTTAPAGAVVVPAGDNSAVDFGQTGTTYYFETGIHTLGGGQYSQIIPGDNSTFVGAPGAVLDGKGVNQYAFTQQAAGVTIKHLTITGFVPPMNEGVVNHDSGNGWLVEANTLTVNKGAALMAGDDGVIRGNCFADNGQYGLNAYQAGDGPTNLLLEGNEFTGNNTEDWETQIPGCGCTGAMKFWSVDKADVRNNWIHHNHGAGIWADNNNNDFLITDNLIEDNDGQAIFYEQSYNGKIVNNTIRRNAWETGREYADRGDRFAIGAIYVSEAGGDSRIPARYTKLEITGNVFEDNWGGVALWENADRFCNSPANTGSDCTLPMGGTQDRVDECSQPGIAEEPLYSDCRWRTRNVDIHHNEFRSDPAKVDGGCPTDFCGVQAVFSNWGSYPDWSPYKERVIQEAITFEQGNKWHDNTYSGSWMFVPFETGNVKTFSAWQAAPYNQDTGSTVN